jgi:hypothetical protein
MIPSERLSHNHEKELNRAGTTSVISDPVSRPEYKKIITESVNNIIDYYENFNMEKFNELLLSIEEQNPHHYKFYIQEIIEFPNILIRDSEAKPEDFKTYSKKKLKNFLKDKKLDSILETIRNSGDPLNFDVVVERIAQDELVPLGQNPTDRGNLNESFYKKVSGYLEQVLDRIYLSDRDTTIKDEDIIKKEEISDLKFNGIDIKLFKIDKSGAEDCVYILKNNPHPNIVEYFGVFLDNGYEIILPSYDLTLYQLFQDYLLSLKCELNILKQICRPVWYLATKGIYMPSIPDSENRYIKTASGIFCYFNSNSIDIKMADFSKAQIKSQKDFNGIQNSINYLKNLLEYVCERSSGQDVLTGITLNVQSSGLGYFKDLYNQISNVESQHL